MPEPGISDRDFNNPTTDRQKPRRWKSRPRIQLPLEYADFQLEDGRALVDVMGESFFLPEGGKRASSIGRKQARPGEMNFGGTEGGGSPISASSTADAGMPNRIRAHGYAATRGGLGDFEAEFTSLSFGPEEGDAPDSLPDSPKSGRDPAGIGGGALKPGVDAPGKPEFTPADILDPRDRLEFENRSIATESAKRQKAILQENLAFVEKKFTAGDISAKAMGRARESSNDKVAELDKMIEGNERLLETIRVKANLDAAELSPRDTPRVEDAREAAEETRRRRTSRSPLSPDGEDAPDGERPSSWRHPRGRMAQPDYEIQQEISKLQQHLDKAEKELADRRRQGSSVPETERSAAIGKTANLGREIGKLEMEAEIVRREEAGKRQLAGRNAPIFIPMAGGKVDTSRLAESRLYKTRDGTLFVWDGENFRDARRLDLPDENGLTFAPMPAVRAIPAEGHPGVAETPDQILADVEKLASSSGALPGAVLHGFAGVRALEAEAKRRKLLHDDALRRDPQGKADRTRNLELGYRSLMGELRGAYADAIAKASPEMWRPEEMAGRAGWPVRAQHVISKFAQGATVVGGKAIKGFATTNGSDLYEKLRNLEKLERDGDFRSIDDSGSQHFLDMPNYQKFLQASPEERVRMKQEVVDGINAIQTGLLYSWGEGLQEFGEKGLSLNKNFEKEFFASKLPEGLGKAFAYTAVAAATAYAEHRGRRGGSKFGRTAATTLLASQELAGQMFDDALKHGATLEQAFRARDLGQMLGLIEAIPIMPILNRLTPELRSTALRRFSELIKSGTETGIKEAAQNFGLNLVAEGVVQNDSDRDVFEGVVDGYKVSFTSDVLKNSLLKAIGLVAGK